MSDIVRRLLDDCQGRPLPIMVEAAREIERLRREAAAHIAALNWFTKHKPLSADECLSYVEELGEHLKGER